jgi:ATP-dependent DNA ligase
MPPVKPMLAKAAPQIPADRIYEPKWDGFRCIVFRDGDEVELGSRNEKPLTRYFPEVVDAVLAQLPPRCVLDGEIILPRGDRLDFEALLQRIHPAASRVKRLADETPAHFVAFDLLALGADDLTGVPFGGRRAALLTALAGARSPIHVTPATDDIDIARRWFREFEGAGLDGIVAKDPASSYLPDKRIMTKIKHARTADCVVGGYRLHRSGSDAVGSLLLGLYDDNGGLQHVGVIGAFSMARRQELLHELAPLVTDSETHPWWWGGTPSGDRTPTEAAGSRWNAKKDLSFVPLRIERVVEVAYDHLEGRRFRHTAQFVRWRDDREPASCRFEQLDEAVGYDLAAVLGAQLR